MNLPAWSHDYRSPLTVMLARSGRKRYGLEIEITAPLSKEGRESLGGGDEPQQVGWMKSKRHS